MMNKKFIKVMCIFLAILMLGSVMVAAIQAFAVEPTAISVVAENSASAVSEMLHINLIDNGHFLV